MLSNKMYTVSQIIVSENSVTIHTSERHGKKLYHIAQILGARLRSNWA